MRVSAGEDTGYWKAARVVRNFSAWHTIVLIFTFGMGFAQTTNHLGGQSVGRRTFESSCAPCHGLNGKGGEHAPDIATSPETVRLSDSEILKILREGKSQAGMPPFAALGPAKISEILNYLRSLQGQRRTPMPVVSAEKGKEVFFGKGGCSDCHMVRGAGGFLGSDLSDYGASHSADEIRDAILSAEKRSGIRKGLAKATTRDGRQISGLVKNEDNVSVQLQAQDGTFHSLEKSDLSELTFDPEPLMRDSYGARLSKLELDELVGYLLSVEDVTQGGLRHAPGH